MITFKEFLAEEAVTPRIMKALSDADFKSELNHYCTQAVDNAENGNFIYRGDKEWIKPYLHMNTTQSTRKSDNHSNYYTELIDTLPSFKNFPKRSKSIIASPSKSKSKPYGDLYKIYPYDNAKVGICKGKDIWDTTINLWGKKLSIATLNSFFSQIGIPQTNVLAELKAFDEKIKEDSKEFRKLAFSLNAYFHDEAELEECRKTFYKDILEAFTPEKLEFKWVYAKDLNLYDYANNELWIEGELIVERTEKPTMLRKIKAMIQ